MSNNPLINCLIITGGSGYIGSRLIKIALDLNYRVILLSRVESFKHADTHFAEWSLGDPIPDLNNLFSIDPSRCALIHLAHDWSDRKDINSSSLGNNLNATQILLNSANKIGIAKFLFASSQSSREDALNSYGRIKWEIENLLKSHKNTLSLRIGLVYGGEKVGMYGLLSKLSSLPILPLVGGGTLVQPIYINLLCLSIIRLANDSKNGWIGLGSSVPITFKEFLINLARTEHSINILILPVPLKLALWGCKVSQNLPLLPKVDPERVLGLAGTQIMNNLYQLNLENSFDTDLNFRFEPKHLRGLTLEAKTIFEYVLKAGAPLSCIKAYTSIIFAQDSARLPIGLPRIIHRFPWMIRFIEPLDLNSTFSRRIQLACTLSSTKINPGCNKKSGQKKIKHRLFIQVFGDLLALPIRVLSQLVNK